MKRDNLVLCGVIKIGDDVNEVFCEIETGELCFELGDTGTTYVIGEITSSDPITLPSVTQLTKIITENNLTGLVYTKSGALAIITEYSAEWRPLTNVALSNGNTIAIDTDIEAEFDEE